MNNQEWMDEAIREVEETGKISFACHIDAGKVLDGSIDIEKVGMEEFNIFLVIAKKIAREYIRRNNKDEAKIE